MHPLARYLPLGFSILFFASGCFPTEGTMPTRTFRPDDLHAECTRESLSDLKAPAWSGENRRVFDAHVQRGEPTVASILGCHVEVLDHCHAPGRADAQGEVLGKDLEGSCTDATHVVRPRSAEHVELTPLSLGDLKLTGTFRGIERQPHGPYSAYDATMYLAQDGDRVTGITRLSTLDHELWGDMLFDGRLEGNVLFFRDQILDDNLGMISSWCAKGGYLIVDPHDGHLSGPWRAPLCAPGTLEMHRVEDRPRVLVRSREGAS